MVNYQPAEEGPCGVNMKTLPSNGDLNSKPPHIKLFPQCDEHLFFSVPLTPRMLPVTNFQNGGQVKEGN